MRTYICPYGHEYDRSTTVTVQRGGLELPGSHTATKSVCRVCTSRRQREIRERRALDVAQVAVLAAGSPEVCDRCWLVRPCACDPDDR